MFETATPGVFYHGSPHRNLTELKCPADVHSNDGFDCGIHFSNRMAYSLAYAGGPKGQVYEAQLITRNPYVSTSIIACDRIYREDVEQLRAAGHDAVVVNWMVRQVIVFDSAQIRLLDPVTAHRERIAHLVSGPIADDTEWGWFLIDERLRADPAAYWRTQKQVPIRHGRRPFPAPPRETHERALWRKVVPLFGEGMSIAEAVGLWCVGECNRFDELKGG